MAKKKSAFNVAVRATSSLFSSAVVVVPLALFFGTIVGFIDIGVLEIVAPEARESAREAARLAESGIQIAPFPQSTMLKLMFSWWAVMLLVEVLLGPIVVAMTIYAARIRSHGGALSFTKALNFALARYGKIVKWHAIAWLTIQVGMIAIIPGILFLLQYAFVDSILCLEDEKQPLARSSRLTKGRRRGLFILAFIWLALNQILGFAQLWALGQASGTMYLIGMMSGAYLINIWMIMVFYTYYEDRTGKAA
jgi:hypothetical protein